MSDNEVNRAIEQIMRDHSFLRLVQADGPQTLIDYRLTDLEATEIVEAARTDVREGTIGTFPSLRKVARFGPLFAAQSASATKVG